MTREDVTDEELRHLERLRALEAADSLAVRKVAYRLYKIREAASLPQNVTSMTVWAHKRLASP